MWWRLNCSRIEWHLEPIEDFELSLSAMDIADSVELGGGGIKGKRPSKKDKLRATGLKEEQS